MNALDLCALAYSPQAVLELGGVFDVIWGAVHTENGWPPEYYRALNASILLRIEIDAERLERERQIEEYAIFVKREAIKHAKDGF